MAGKDGEEKERGQRMGVVKKAEGRRDDRKERERRGRETDQDFIMGFAGNSLRESRCELQLQPDVEMADAALYLNLC